MAITFPLSHPVDSGSEVRSPTGVTLVVRKAASIARSPFSGKEQVYEHAGEILGWQVAVSQVSREAAAPWMAMLAKLRGPVGTVLFGDTAATEPLGTAPGTPLVDGPSQTGYELDTKGWTPSQSGILLAGDWIQIGNRLYMNVTDASSDGSGEATLDIFPALRESPSDEAPIITDSPKGLFRLASNEYQIAAIDGGKTYDIAFELVEALG